MMDILLSETGMEILAWLLAAAWTVFKASKWYQEVKASQVWSIVEKAENCVAQAAEALYRAEVAAVKQAKQGDKLTGEEQTALQDKCIDMAIDIGKQTGLDLLKIFGSKDSMRLIVVAMVKKLKAGGTTLSPALVSL